MPSTQLYPLSLHDALPISHALRRLSALRGRRHGRVLLARAGRVLAGHQARGGHLPWPHADHRRRGRGHRAGDSVRDRNRARGRDRKSTRLNSSHMSISYAVHPALPSFPTRRSSDLSCPTAPQRSSRPAARASSSRSSRASTRRSSSSRWTPAVAACRSSAPRARAPCWRLSTRPKPSARARSEEHTSELQSHVNLVCRPPSSTLFPYTTLFRSLMPYGASALFAAGGTGEFFSLEPGEYSQVIKLAVDTCRGRMPIIGAAGAGTVLATQYATETERAGEIGRAHV